MPDQLKIRRLQTLRDLLTSNRIKEDDKKRQFVADTDGRMIGLSDPEALAAIDRRIAAQQGA